MRFAAAAFAVLGGLAAAAGCKKPEPAPSPHVKYVEVVEGKRRVLTGSVGEGKFQSEATYVLVDVRNTGPRDLLVTIGGHLVDSSGNRIAALRPQSLRVPSAGMRMFSLVDSDNAARPSASGADIEVAGAVAPEYDPPVVITDGRVDMDSGRAVAQGNVVNTAKRPVKVIVMAGFYDAQMNPVRARSTKLSIDAGEKRGVMLAGPQGSRSGYLFVGQYAY